MLKKLVRYGNSNALVLDKAILELLNIAEGSVVKISTDGRSIILTPHQPTELPINETLTSTEALLMAGVKESMKAYPQLSNEQKIMLETKLQVLTKKHYELMMLLGDNEPFQKEVAELKMLCGDDKQLFLDQYKAARNNHAPEIKTIEDTMLQIHEQCKILSGGKSTENMQDMQKQMEKEMTAIFTKHKETQAEANNFMNSPEYQHRAQLITEKYQNNVNSVEFMTEMKQLIYEFCPAMKQLHQDLENVSKKYNPTF